MISISEFSQYMHRGGVSVHVKAAVPVAVAKLLCPSYIPHSFGYTVVTVYLDIGIYKHRSAAPRNRLPRSPVLKTMKANVLRLGMET
jgi:hypothetical protein